MKKYLKIAVVPAVAIFVLPILFSIINLFAVEIPPFMYLIAMFIIAFITGILVGLISEDKAYLKGLAVGGALCLIMFILSFIFASDHSVFNFIYYFIVVASTTLGAMIGITKKG